MARKTSNIPVEDLKPGEVADAIHARLKKLEASDWNEHTWTDRNGQKRKQKHLFYSNASFRGGRIHLQFISYQGGVTVDVDQARDYLEWLRRGNKGTYYAAQHIGVIRKSKAQVQAEADAEARSVAYRRERSMSKWSDDADVLNALYVPEGAETVPASEVQEDDRVFWQGKWRKITSNHEYVPVMDEEAHALAAEIQNATRRGDYAKAADLAQRFKIKANQLADGRDFEQTLNFAGTISSITVTPETRVPVKRSKKGAK